MKKSSSRPASRAPRHGTRRVVSKPAKNGSTVNPLVALPAPANECIRCGLEYCDCSCPENQPGTVPPAGEYWQKR